MNRLARAQALWERFWFDDIPPDVYSLLRITFGVLGLIGLFGLTPVSLHWSLDGITPVPGEGIGLRGLLGRLGLESAAGWGAFALMFGAFACMTVGYRSRPAVALCFVGSVLQTRWNHLPLSLAHQVQIAVLFCLVWANTGSSLALDSWLARRQGARRADGLQEGHPIWPLRLIRYQVALIYLSSGLWKLFGAPWRDGTAIYYALNNNLYGRFPDLAWQGAGELTTVLTYGTLVWEIAFAFLLLHPLTRRVALITGVMVHVGIWATLEVGLFSWLMLGTYWAFLDPRTVARTVRRWSAFPLGTAAKSERSGNGLARSQ